MIDVLGSEAAVAVFVFPLPSLVYVCLVLVVAPAAKVVCDRGLDHAAMLAGTAAQYIYGMDGY